MGNLRCKCPMQIQLPVKIRAKPKADVVTVVTRVSTKPGFKCASDAGCFQDGAPRPVPVHKVLFLCACVLVKPMWAAYLEDLGSFQAFIPTQWFSTQGTILFPRGHVPIHGDNLLLQLGTCYQQLVGRNWMSLVT